MLKFMRLLIIWAVGCNCFTPPAISFSDLLSVSSSSYVRSTLTHTGILAVNDVPQLATTRRQALSDIIWCLSRKTKNGNRKVSEIKNNGVKASLPDGTVRRTLVLKDGFEPLSYCSEIQPQLEMLRHLVRMVANSVAMSLDLSKIPLHIETVNGNPLTTMSQIVHQAKSLDHFHLYEGNFTAQSSTLKMHIDAGIFIVFVPPLWKGEKDQKNNSGLFVQIPNKPEPLPLILNENSVVVMVGMGAQTFLDLPLRPVPHSLEVPRGTLRSWYGHMVLLPMDVLVGDTKQITFSEFWSKTHEEISSGLGYSSSSKKLLGMNSMLIDQANPACPMGTTDCWSMSAGNICIEDITCPSGIQPMCMADQSPMGPHMCVEKSKCKLQCNGTGPVTNPWCMGGTDMYMDGFKFASNANMCTMLFFSIFTLDTPSKLFWGCVVTFFFSMCWPGVKSAIKYLGEQEKKKSLANEETIQ